MDIRTQPQIIPIERFKKIAEENEVFFWHFILKDHNQSTDIAIKSLYEPYDGDHILSVLVDTLNLTVFESYCVDSVDFLISLNIPWDKIFNERTQKFHPLFLGFKKNTVVAGSNITTKCHCLDGISDVVYQTDPSIFEKVSILGIEKENLE
jgi:hypothetical protein